MNEHPISIEIRALEAEIERLKRMYAEMFCFREDLILENMELRARIEGLKNCSDVNWIRVHALLTRAAEALEEDQPLVREPVGSDLGPDRRALIDELRKAAE